MIYRSMYGVPAWRVRSPFNELDRMQRQMDRLFDAFGGQRGTPGDRLDLRQPLGRSFATASRNVSPVISATTCEWGSKATGLTMAAPALGSFLSDRLVRRIVGFSLVVLAVWMLMPLLSGGGHAHHAHG